MGITIDPTQSPSPYTAHGDGVTDDRAALQKAIDDVEAAGGGVVLLRGGLSFVVASGNGETDAQGTSLLIDSPNVTLASDGSATIIIRSGANHRTLIVRNTSRVTIRGIEFRNELTGTVDSPLCIQASSDVHVLHCRFVDCDFGVTISEDTSLRGETTLGSDIVTDVKNLDRWSVGDAIAGAGISNGGTHVTVEEKDTGAGTLRLSALATASVEDNSLFNRTTGACNDIEIAFNEFRNCGTNGIQQFPKAKSRNISIVSNTFKDCGLGVSGGSSIKCGQATENTLVTGNRIIGGGHGIAAVNYESVFVEGNELLNTIGWALSVGVGEHVNYRAGYLLSVFRNNVAAWTDTPPTTSQGLNVNGGATLAGGTVANGPIEFEGNTFYSPFFGFSIRLKKPLKNIRIKRNTWIDQRNLSYCDAQLDAAPEDIAFVGNETIVRDPSYLVQWRVEGVTSALIDGNTFIGLAGTSTYPTPLRIAGSDITVSSNRFIGSNIPGFTEASAIRIVSGSATSTYRIVGNLLDNRSLSPGLLYLIDNKDASGATILERKNVSMQESVAPIRFTTGISTAGWTSTNGVIDGP